MFIGSGREAYDDAIDVCKNALKPSSAPVHDELWSEVYKIIYDSKVGLISPLIIDIFKSKYTITKKQ